MAKQLIFILALSACVPGKQISNESGVLDVRTFGATGNDGIEDTQAFLQAFNYLNSTTEYQTLFIPSGRYLIGNQISIKNLRGDISIIGEPGTVIELQNTGFLMLRPKTKNMILRKSVESGSKEIDVVDASDVFVNDVVHLQSNSPFETGWNYKENDLHILTSVKKNNLTLRDGLLFNYDPSKEVVNVFAFRPKSVLVRGITFHLRTNEDVTGKISAITAWGVHLTAKDLTFTGIATNGLKHRAINLARCPSISIDGIRLRNLDYGVLMNFCRDIRIINVEAIDCRHATVPATACVNVKVSKVYGLRCQGVIDAHVSFNVHYDSIQDMDATQYSNCRALGVTISNSVFQIDSSFYQTYAYWSAQTLTDEYKALYWKYDVTFNNVQWIAKRPSNFNGLTAFSCRNMYITNCTTHNISQYGGLSGNVRIENSRIGSIRIRSTKVLIDRCELDGRLFREARFVLRFSASGDAIITRTKINHYAPGKTFLFQRFYNTENKNSVTFIDSDICELAGITDTVVYPNKRYRNLRFINTDYKFREHNSRRLFFD